MRARTCLLLTAISVCVHLSHICFCCVLLLNGWAPLTIRERAERAQLTALGQVLKTYKSDRTLDDTYTAEIRLLTVYKGHENLARVTNAKAHGNVYNVTNFGNRAQCYADVETGTRYIFFMTLYDGALSAEYHDLFGAAADFTEIAEEELLEYLGWDQWSEWSSCTKLCDGGHQYRTRNCPRTDENLNSKSNENDNNNNNNENNNNDKKKSNTKTDNNNNSDINSSNNIQTDVRNEKDNSLRNSVEDIYTRPADDAFYNKKAVSGRTNDGIIILGNRRNSEDVAQFPPLESTLTKNNEDYVNSRNRSLYNSYKDHSNNNYNNNYNSNYNNNNDNNNNFPAHEDIRQDMNNELHRVRLNSENNRNFRVVDARNKLNAQNSKSSNFNNNNNNSNNKGSGSSNNFNNNSNNSASNNSNTIAQNGPSSCIGVSREVRACNIFSCTGSNDLLTLMGVRNLPPGVTRVSNRPTAYSLTKTARLSLPTSQIYDITLPSTFAILLRVRLKKRKQRGYFFVVSDSQEKQHVALFFGRKTKFQYLGNNYGFKLDVLDGKWHSIGIRVGAELVTLYADCDVTMTRRLRSKGDYLGTNLVMSVGPYFSKYGRQFEGEVEQLVISGDPNIASLQCGLHHLTETSIVRPTPVTLPIPFQNGTTTSVPLQCIPACQNGGLCNADGVCICPYKYTGRYCQFSKLAPQCTPPCQNGGNCTIDGRCECPFGFRGPSCQSMCNFDCQNGGRCVGPNQCACPKGYIGQDCSTPVCRRGCYNGGQCVAPNKCACPVGYQGKRCHKVRCRPKCKNGGICVSPGQCMCTTGYYGGRCQKFQCEIKCENGGQCVGPRQCRCPPLFFGRRCHKEKCNITCLNGGRCHHNECRCPPGFSGKRCEKRTCNYEHYLVPHRRTYRKVIRDDYPVPCGYWSKQTCTRTRLKYVLITKDTYKSAYRCV